MRLRALLFTGLAFLGGCGLGHRPPPLNYVAIGASDALGVGAALPDDYVHRIRDAVRTHGRGVELVNLGVRAANTDVVRATVRSFLTERRDIHLVTVMVGANDLINGRRPDEFRADLKLLLTMLRQGTDGLVVVAGLPGIGRLARPRLPEAVTPGRIAAFEAVIAEEATVAGMPLIELSRSVGREALVTRVDGYTPNADGHLRIATAFLRVILPAIGIREATLARPNPVYGWLPASATITATK